MALHRKPLREAHPALIPTVTIAATALLVIGLGIAVDPLIQEFYNPPTTVEKFEPTKPKVKPKNLPDVLMIDGDLDAPPSSVLTPVPTAVDLPPTRSIPVPVPAPVVPVPRVSIESVAPNLPPVSVPLPPKVQLPQLPPVPVPQPPKIVVPKPLPVPIPEPIKSIPEEVIPKVTQDVPDVGQGVADELLDIVQNLPVPGKTK